jgi:hypothetical protein
MRQIAKGKSVNDLEILLVRLLTDFWSVLIILSRYVFPWFLAFAWFGWWLWGVSWQKTWPVLRQGGWVGAVLIMVIAALTWSQMAPSSCSFLGVITVPNFWWQLGSVGLIALLTFFCGWLQGVFGWGPAEVVLEPQEAIGHGDEFVDRGS